jgi:shikimate dehydrogenase
MRAMSLDGEYRLFPVPPLPDGVNELESLVAKLRHGQVRGLNVTIPHKQDVVAYLDDSSPAATSIGAVNTLFIKDGRLVGENTDAPGFMADLSRVLDSKFSTGTSDQRSTQRHALILGAGGSARAAAYALLVRGWQVTVAARRLEQSGELVSGLQRSINRGQGSTFVGQSSEIRDRFTAIDLQPASIRNLQSKISLVVNATPVGMWPHIDASPWPVGPALPDGALVYDLIYNPAETVLLKAARLAGLPTSNGLGMLIEQAALALELWTGRQVPRRPMWEAAPEFKLEGSFQGDNP